MKLVQVAGYLGSGKTTLILSLVKELATRGRKVAVLVNDVGEVPVDGQVMEKYGLTVKDIGGGCICCQVAGNMRSTLNNLARNQKPDIVIIEPTGMAVPSAIRDGATIDPKFDSLNHGPTIVLFDTTRAEKFLTYETLERLVNTQLKDADIVALSKTDSAAPEKVEYARSGVLKINPKARIVMLATKTGEGVPELAAAALGEGV